MKGTTIAARFKNPVLVGRGAQADVWRAIDPTDGVAVAVKVRPITPDASAEARLLSNVPPHPALPRFCDAFEEAGHHFLVTEWVPGLTIQDMLNAGGPMPFHVALGIAERVADALEHLHARGLVHGDVKPSNVVVSDDERVVVVDLGIAQSDAAAAPRAGAAAEGPTSAAADVYGLAATVHAMLTGALPVPVGPREIPGPPGVTEAVRAALATDPERRPSVASFLDMLRPPPTPTNVPVETTAFIGRRSELNELSHLLDTHRLVTLIGPAGCGKTRLASRLAADNAWRFPDGVFFVPLAPVGGRDGVEAAIVRALGIDGAAEPIDAATRRLAEARALIVLDNCEHVAEIACDVASRLIDGSPATTVIATSRVALRAPEERAWLIRTLDVADPLDAPTAVRRSDAVRLFEDRARAVVGAFEIDEANAATVARICARLDGIPLAIELAASSLAVQELEALARRIDEDVLSIDEPSEDRTLSATIGSSVDLLDDEQRRLFRRLGVFAGAVTPDAIEAVCGAGSAEALASASLLIRDAGPFRMLEAVRAYARRLLEAEDDLARIRDRHAETFAERVALGRARSDDQWQTQLAPEEPDIVQAMEHLAARDDPRAFDIAITMATFWMHRSPRDARTRLAALAERPIEDPLKTGALLHRLSELEGSLGDARSARALAERSVGLLRRAGDEVELGKALGCLTFALRLSGDYRTARGVAEELLAIHRRTGSRDVAMALYDLGEISVASGDMDAAERYLREGLNVSIANENHGNASLFCTNLANLYGKTERLDDAEAIASEGLEHARRSGAPARIVSVLVVLSSIAAAREDHPAALEIATEALEQLTSIGNRSGQMIVLGNMSDSDIRLGAYDRAEQRLHEAFRIALEIGTPEGMQRYLANLTKVAVERGDHARAATLLGAFGAIREAAGSGRGEPTDEERAALRARCEDAIGAAAYDAALARGHAMSTDELASFVLG